MCWPNFSGAFTPRVRQVRPSASPVLAPGVDLIAASASVLKVSRSTTKAFAARSARARLAAWVLALGLWCLSGCTCDPGFSPRHFACAAQADCAVGWVCFQGECLTAAEAADAGVRADAGMDAGPPPDSDAGTDGGSDGGPPGGDDAGAAGSQLELVGFPQTIRLGECSGPFTVRAVQSDGGASIDASARTITLSSSSGTVAFFGSTDCSVPTQQVSIPPNLDSITFRMRTSALQSVTATASAAELGTAVGLVTVVPLVRRGTCDLQAGATTRVCPITPPQLSTAHTLLWSQVTSAATAPEVAEVNCELTALDGVTCSRNASGAVTQVVWQTVEFEALNVQRVSRGTDGGHHFVSFNSVTPSRTFTLASSLSAGMIWDHTDTGAVTLESATSAAVRFELGGSNVGALTVQVAELTGATVSRSASAAMPADAGQRSVSIPARNLSTTFLLHSWTNPIAGAAAPFCDRAVRGAFSSPTTLDFTRGIQSVNSVCNDVALGTIAFEAVDLGAHGTVTPFTFNASAGVADGTVALATPANLARSTVFASGQSGGTGQSLGESDLTNTTPSPPGEVSFLLGLDGGGSLAGTHVVLHRGSTLGSARVSGFVVEWTP